MQLRPIFTIDQPFTEDLREALAGIGGRPDAYDTGWQVFTDDERSRVVAELEARGLGYDLFYEAAPEPGDPTEDLAAYLPLDDLSELTPDLDAPLLAFDDSLTPVASRSLLDLVEAHTDGPVWEPRADGLFVLASAPELPDPVRIPRAMFSSEGTNGLWAVQSDGRELLTAESLKAVRRAGIALAPVIEVDDRTLPRRPLPVYSGAVLTALRDREVQGIIGPPAFLVTS